MTLHEATVKARCDFAAKLDTEMTLDAGDWIYGYKGNDSFDVLLTKPLRIRVTSSPDMDITHVVDTFLDPYWNVDPLETTADIEGMRSFWIFGPSYEFVGY